MTGYIQPLPEDVIHLIAAGEVIDSPAAVVRELVENAIDAHADRITISLWLDQWRVRVADNGEGMSLVDLQYAATAHSTSKIQTRQDLWKILSLGFRGEALHSLAQLSELEICSRTAAAGEGWRIHYDGQGEPVQAEPIALSPGTIVTAADLFGNWLPRRQGLPSVAQQLRAIQLTVQHLALCHPQITWQVEQDDRPWFAIWASQTAKQVLPQWLRDVQSGDLQEVSEAELYLLLGLPDRCHRRRPDWVKVAVNGRVVNVPELEQTLLYSLRRTLPRDRHPVGFVHLRLSPEQIDWNRHPAKAEVYLHQMEQWQTRLEQAIEQALRLQPESLVESAYNAQLGQMIRAAEGQGGYGKQADSTSGAASDDASQPLLPLKAIAQVHHMYILVEHPTGMWLVEQHIAHERVLYERLSQHWQVVPLTSPILLENLTPKQVEQLQRIGLSVEEFGDRVWAVRTAPAPLAQRSDCADALWELSLGGDLESALVATACRTAIRNGTPLAIEVMQDLIQDWQQTRNPRTCPHGRPIYLPLEESSLSRFFRRHWVIGKSHGI